MNRRLWLPPRPTPFTPPRTRRSKRKCASWRRNPSRAERKIRERFPALRENLSTHILCGSPEQSIVAEAEDWGADLIVVGSHGYGFWERMFLGSVSNAVVHHASCSVLVVRKSASKNGKH